jgi:hypothetical protein
MCITHTLKWSWNSLPLRGTHSFCWWTLQLGIYQTLWMAQTVFLISSSGLYAMWAIVITFRPSSVRHHFTFLIFSSETTGPIATKLWWNGPWMAPFQIWVRWSWLPSKMAVKLKIEKRGDEILIVHCCFSISQNELKF